MTALSAVRDVMMPVSAEAAEPDNGAQADQGLYLVGRPTLRGFLRHVRHNAANPPGEGALVDEWHAARDVIRTLEKDEAGVADDAPITPLGGEHAPLLAELLRDPLIKNGFNTVPTEIAMVELNRLVVYQKHIDLTHVGRLEREWPAVLDTEQLFRVCLPCDHPPPPVRWSRVHNDKYVFVSPSNDLRFLGVMTLNPDQIQDYPPPGNLVGVVGIAVGFGSNFLNAIHTEGRLILRNGSHRAYALRKLGVTHVPCIIQHVNTKEKLEVVGSSEIERNPDLYIRHPRPPMLRDYFDPRLRKVMPVHRRQHVVTIGYSLDENVVPAL